ncbi:MAG: ferritin family protein [Myxococcaceae bacterium]|nr:ferritin family protein [Myxococcaceae bacterium]
MTHADSAPGIDFEALTLKDALDLAVLIEEEARDRYEELAAQLLLHHNRDAARFFTRMVRVEELHRAALVEKREKLFGRQKPAVGRELLFEVEAPEYDAVRADMTERQALSTALQSERKAYRFFSSALEHVQHRDVKTLFTELCAEELEHIRLVQGELARLPEPGPLEATDVSDDPAPQ